MRSRGRPDLAALPGGLPASAPALLASGWAAAPRDRPRSGCELLKSLRKAAPTADLPPPLPPALTPSEGAPAAAAADRGAAVTGLGRAPKITEWRAGPVLAECLSCYGDNLAGVSLGCAAGHEYCMYCTLHVIRGELTQEAPWCACPRRQYSRWRRGAAGSTSAARRRPPLAAPPRPPRRSQRGPFQALSGPPLRRLAVWGVHPAPAGSRLPSHQARDRLRDVPQALLLRVPGALRILRQRIRPRWRWPRPRPPLRLQL